MAESRIGSPRRFYLLKRITAKNLGDIALSAVWHSKQDEQPGVTLPDGFPQKAALAEVGYVAKADLDGADADELIQYASLTRRAADAVIAAFAAL